MRNHAARRVFAITSAAVLGLVVALTPHAAFADTPDPAAPETVVERTEMTIGGYDAEVAEANGFKIVTHADGTQESVPVTDAAIAQRQRDDQIRAAAPQDGRSAAGIVCGESWANGVKKSGDLVAFQTGFIVYGAAYEHTWRVNAVGAITANSFTTEGAGPASGNKNWSGGIPSVIGPGIGGVPAFSGSAQVILRDGTVCWSIGPTFAFG